MHLKRFRRETVQEALRAAREELGADALVLSTRVVAAPGARGWMGRRHVEVTAAAERPLVSGDRQQMVWSVRTHGDRHVDVRSRQVEWNEGRSVRYLSEGDRDLRVESELIVTPGPADWGTQASLRVGYSLPGGVVAETLAKWLGSAPELLVSTVLHRFKALLETGEFPTLERNPSARDNDDNP